MVDINTNPPPANPPVAPTPPAFQMPALPTRQTETEALVSMYDMTKKKLAEAEAKIASYADHDARVKAYEQQVASLTTGQKTYQDFAQKAMTDRFASQDKLVMEKLGLSPDKFKDDPLGGIAALDMVALMVAQLGSAGVVDPTKQGAAPAAPAAPETFNDSLKRYNELRFPK